jgi:hypothetical protein
VNNWEPGVYEVASETKNPRGDRRCTRDFWRVPVWTAGLQVLVERDPDLFNQKLLVVRPVQTYLVGNSVVVGGRREQEQLAALLPALRPVPESLATILLTTRSSADSVLRELLRAGVVDLKTVRLAAEGGLRLPAAEKKLLEKDASVSDLAIA